MTEVDWMDRVRDAGLDGLFEAGRNPRDALLVVLHGRGDAPESFRGFRSELGLDDASALLLRAPDAYYGGSSWYPLPPDHGLGIVRSRALLTSAFAAIESAGFAPERTLLFGFSQGCLLTLEFGARHPRRLAGYLGVSGYAFDPTALAREMSAEAMSGDWLITHGTEDDVLPVERTRAQIAELRSGGLPVDYREYRKAHTIDPVRELPELRQWARARFAL